MFVLRLGLIWFIFLWAAHKVILPGQYRNLARNFDGITPTDTQIYATAGLQIVVCLLALIGIFRLVSYGALLIMHAFTVSRRWEGFLDPFALNDAGNFPIHRNHVIDREGKIVHAEYVPEITNEPDYEEVLATVKELK